MNEFLFEKLNEYGNEDIYPFHMPGHKRTSLTAEKTYSIDITEIDGFDNLHNPEGIIRDMEDYARKLYGTVESHLLVNGSSAGLLAAISAVCNYGEKILVSRNCHKSVFNGIALRGLKSSYLYPEICETYGLNGGITVEMVRKALKKESDIKAVLITSPTYDGIVSDVRGIAEEVHKYGIPLIVDEAHGAHLPFSAGLFPKSALECGADLVIHSLHKTLPAFTQTGLLHINSDRVHKERVSKFLNIYQSTSPSYILMSGIGSCLKWLGEKGKESFGAYEKELVFWRSEYEKICSENDKIKLVGKEIVGKQGIFDFDVSKLIFSTKNTGITGKELYDFLLEKHGLQLEMDAKDYCLALSSVFDRREGFKRLKQALRGLEGHFKGAVHGFETEKVRKKDSVSLQNPEAKMTLGEALDKKATWCSLRESVGKISGDYVYLYPPGIPLILPGEIIGEEFVHDLEELERAGFALVGLDKEKIKILLK